MEWFPPVFATVLAFVSIGMENAYILYLFLFFAGLLLHTLQRRRLWRITDALKTLGAEPVGEPAPAVG